MSEATQNTEVLQNPFRYNTIMNKLRDFRCGIEGDQFDVPGWFYFKLFFYFDAGYEGSNRMCSGLLGCNFDQIDKYIENKQYEVIHDNNADIAPVMNANTAYNFLRLNGEEERAGKLKNFIRMLSDISTNKPWYFQSIEGLNTAMERKIFSEHELKLEDRPKEITIKCLSDAYDNRIGTLLDLYRDIAYSYSLKKEILPANLRKFDMGLFIYSKPIRQLISDNFTLGGSDFVKMSASKMGGTEYRNQKALQQYPLYDNDTSARISMKQQDLKNQSATENFFTSAKYIEFQNCEIDYNSSSTGYGTITNTEGFPMDYTIKITFDDIYEERYNEFLVKTIGDFVARDFYKDMLPNSSYKNTQEPIQDTVYASRYFPQGNEGTTTTDSNQTSQQINKEKLEAFGNLSSDENTQLQSTVRTDKPVAIANLSGKEPKQQRQSGPLSNAVGQLFGAAMSDVNTQMRHIAMGNLAEYGMNAFTGMINNIVSGNVFAAASGINAFMHRNDKPSQETISESSLGTVNQNTEKLDSYKLGEAEQSNERLNGRILGEAEQSNLQITIQELDATGNRPHIGTYHGEWSTDFIGEVNPKTLDNRKKTEIKKQISARNLMNNIR